VISLIGFVNADVSDFCRYLLPPTTTCCLPRLPAAPHNYLLPPTTTCCLPRLPAASHNYLLPPTTTCCLPRLSAASHDSLLPPTTIYCLPRLPAASHDYLLPPMTTCGPHDTCCPPRNSGTIATVARKDDNTTEKVPSEKGW
jgi:hypothetical protein